MKHWTLDEPRHCLVLDKEIIRDCPGPFLTPSPEPGPGHRLLRDTYWGPHGSSVIANLLWQYLDRSRGWLFGPFAADGWELTNILRAADRHLGRETLLAWGKGLGTGHSAHKVLRQSSAASVTSVEHTSGGSCGNVDGRVTGSAEQLWNARCTTEVHFHSHPSQVRVNLEISQ
jgi:hypothetical protein